MNYLKRLQNQPEEKRKSTMKIAIIISGLVIFLIWLLLLPQTLKKNKGERMGEFQKVASEFNKGMSKYNFDKFKENLNLITKKQKENQPEGEKTIETPRLPIEE